MTPDEAKEEAKKVGRDFRRFRAGVLAEAWERFRDAPGGPMIDAMHIINDMLEEIPYHDKDSGTGK